MMTGVAAAALLAQTDPLSSAGGTYTGWTGLGVLAAVLYWLFRWYMPAKDRAAKELMVNLLDRADAQAEADRKARHEALNVFQAAITTLEANRHETAAELKDALASFCRFSGGRDHGRQ